MTRSIPLAARSRPAWGRLIRAGLLAGGAAGVVWALPRAAGRAA
jgi:hypothetical protein